jgi:hypothetical protein
LIDDSEDKGKKRRRLSVNLKEKRTGFLAGRGSNDILLVYPFNGDKTMIENASVGLKEAASNPNCNVVNESQQGTVVEGSSRAHYLTICVSDFERLEYETEYLNDTLIDFWMQW